MRVVFATPRIVLTNLKAIRNIHLRRGIVRFARDKESVPKDVDKSIGGLFTRPPILFAWTSNTFSEKYWSFFIEVLKGFFAPFDALKRCPNIRERAV